MQGSDTSGERPASVWRFDHSALQDGDVILERGHRPASKVIMAVDGGPYSHVLLWLGGTDFLEAVEMGVRLISYARFFLRDPADWMVLRHPDSKAGSLAAREARSFAHMEYGLGGAIATKIPGAWKTNPAAMFCSQVVAAAYENVGYPLVSKASAKVSPNDLTRQSALVPVSPIPLLEHVLSEEEHADIDRWFDRDRAYADTAMAREVQASQEVFELIRGLYPKLTLPPEFRLACPPRNLGEAFNVLQFLDWATASRISGVMLPELEQRGYFDFLFPGLNELSERLDGETSALAAGHFDPVTLARLVAHYRDVLPSHRKTMGHHRDNADAYGRLFMQLFPLPIFERMARMHRQIETMLQSIIRLEEEFVAASARRQ
ncbi:hypothetical protein [Roseinatronobacter alkalisoli]|uniref:Uncharacterized protein n=1 Tax=Roseinatronobacter alkalisoli TaxID=3028235 RepID=A0ABT5TFX7_9RHOB|nr:hypothetical protein [Roseinatronobacter sp. HJB301]MDD7973926.1 hypothetical protein [Roseinatronobacter sp. HJB301]